jgi:hypothetical protein
MTFQNIDEIDKYLGEYKLAYEKYKLCLDSSGNECNDERNKFKSSLNSLNVFISPSFNKEKLYGLNVNSVYENNNELRNKLSSQLQDIYIKKDFIRDETNINNGLPSIQTIDSSLYIGLVWTTVATACLYIIFVKL